MNRSFLVLSIVSIVTPAAQAATDFNGPGSIFDGVNWSAGLPGSGNDGTISVNTGTIPDGTPGFAAGTYTIDSSGDLTAVDEFTIRVAGDASTLTWNMTGGTISARWFAPNGTSASGDWGDVIFNMSGGSIVLTDATGTGLFGSLNGAEFNISGAAVIDATFVDLAVTVGGSIDIASDWTGSWTHGFYDGDLSAWESLFTAGDITYNGNAIDGTTFNTTFAVTNNGATLALIPEPGSLGLLGLGALCVLRRRRI